MGQLILRLSFPVMAGMLVFSLLSLVDVFFVARLGTAALAAITFCIPIEALMISLASAMGTGISSLISRSLGNKEVRFADNTAWHGLMISLILGVFISWWGLSNIDHLLIKFGCPSEIFWVSRDYLQVIFWGCLFIFISIITGNIVQGEGNTFWPMVASIGGILVNVILDPILIFGLGPLGGLGIRGAAVAGILGQIVATIILGLFIIRQRHILPWRINNSRPSLKVIAGIFQVGVPTLIVELTGVLIMVLLNKVLVGFGYMAVAVLGIFLRVRSFFFLPVFGLAQGAMPIAGFAYGAGNYDRIKETIIKAAVIASLILTLAWLIMQTQASWVLHFFSTNSALAAAGVDCMKLATIFLPLMGPIIIFNAVLQALGKGMSLIALSLIRQLGFFLPAFIFLPHYLHLNGVWLAFSFSELLSGLLTLIFFRKLWQDLQGGKAYPWMRLFRGTYLWKRALAWLKW